MEPEFYVYATESPIWDSKFMGMSIVELPHTGPWCVLCPMSLWYEKNYRHMTEFTPEKWQISRSFSEHVRLGLGLLNSHHRFWCGRGHPTYHHYFDHLCLLLLQEEVPASRASEAHRDDGTPASVDLHHDNTTHIGTQLWGCTPASGATTRPRVCCSLRTHWAVQQKSMGQINLSHSITRAPKGVGCEALMFARACAQEESVGNCLPSL